MYQNKKFLALIPARSGSKRLKDKNIKDLCGKPLLAYSIESALRSKYIDEVVLSTDSKLYAEIGKSYGASVPELRPAHLSDDNASSIDVALHTISLYGESNFDYLVILQPTSPLRSAEDIDKAIEFALSKGAHSVISVCECEHSPLWCNTLDNDLNMSNFLNKQVVGVRSQDLPTFYRLNGVIFITLIDAFLRTKSFYNEKSFAFIMEQEKSIDIDNALDFNIAKALMNAANNNVAGGGAIKCNPCNFNFIQNVHLFKEVA